ncbi:MAG: cyclic nucleotide-binding domain-containing protein [Myxococcota bacterium]
MPWAGALDDAALVLLAEHARNRRFAAGELLLVEGQPVRSMYIVIDGQVTVTVRGTRIATVTPGRPVGVVSLLARDPLGAHAIADVDSGVVEIPAEALLAAYRENFSLVRNVLRLQSRGLLDARRALPTDEGSDEGAPLGAWRRDPLTLVERVFRIRENSLFSRVNLDAVFELAKHVVERRFAPGEPIWSVDEPSGSWFQIDYGQVRCANKNGESTVVGSDYVLGSLDCWAERGRSYNTRAETALIVQEMRLETMLRILETHHDLAMELIMRLSQLTLEGRFARAD